ncbi:MAG: tryptophan-rich sensory protein [Planctomycetaceae bacterium]|nr:MAG: tryptophan-rich sensory protein [Planctomycetaceae bacterium]
MKDVIRQLSVLVAAIVMIAANVLANALPLNGQTTGSISDSFPVYFVPAGYVFSIWGLIYLGVITYVVYQLLPSQRSNPLHRRIGYLFVAGSAANVAWIFLWHYEQFILTLVAMLILLVSLTAIYGRLQASPPSGGIAERLAVRLPFSIYLGWITVATIANVTVVLDDLRWDGWGV